MKGKVIKINCLDYNNFLANLSRLTHERRINVGDIINATIKSAEKAPSEETNRLIIYVSSTKQMFETISQYHYPQIVREDLIENCGDFFIRRIGTYYPGNEEYKGYCEDLRQAGIWQEA